MNRLWILSGLMAALALSGCVTTPKEKTTEPEVVVEQEPLTPEEIELLRKYRLSAGELSIWRSAAFKEQFAESYIAATEIEPPLRSEDQREQLIEIFEDLEPTDEEKALLEASQKEKDLIAAGAVAEASKLQEEREAKAGRKQADRMEKAAIALREMQGEGANAIVDFSLGNIHFQRGEYEEAQKAYEIAVGKYRAFRRAWKNLGIIYIRKEEPDLEKAAEAMTRVIELGGGDGVTYGLLGFCYMSLGKNMSAESAYRMAILLDAETLDWKLGLVQSMYKQGRFPETIALTGTLLKTRPGDAQLWMMQANAYLGQGKTLDAAENFEMVDRLGKSTAASLQLLGDIYVNEGLYELAVSTHIRAMEKSEKKRADALAENPESPKAKESKPDRPIKAAAVIASRSAYGPAKTLLEAVVSTYGKRITGENERTVLRLQAKIAVAEGDEDAEAAVLEKMVQRDGTDGEAWILLGRFYTRKAVAAASKVKEATAHELAMKQAQEEAQERLDKAKDAGEADTKALEDLLAEAKSATQQASEALAEVKSVRNALVSDAEFRFEQAERLEKFEARALVEHAQLLVKLGKYDEAIPLLKNAQDLDYRENVQEYLKGVERAANRKSS